MLTARFREDKTRLVSLSAARELQGNPQSHHKFVPDATAFNTATVATLWLFHFD